MTSLAWASGRGHTEIVQMLVAKGAKVNIADKVRKRGGRRLGEGGRWRGQMLEKKA